MSPSQFYRSQATEQQLAADAATLQNVRERCARASNAWAALAYRSERSDTARTRTASANMLATLSENPDRGLATVC